MLRRSTYALALALALSIALVPTVLAGGWAVSTLDAAPASFRAGESQTIGFTIRQHGVEPVRAEQFGGEVSVRARPVEAGQPIVFPARADGPIGHYVAEVRFPSAGGWVWEIVQGPFAPQPLGSLTVQPAPAPSAVPTVASAPAPAPIVASAPAPAPVAPAAVPASAPGSAPLVAPAAAPAVTRGPTVSGAVLALAALVAGAAATLALLALGRRPDLVAPAFGDRPATARG
jgi:hypothetical protein